MIPTVKCGVLLEGRGRIEVIAGYGAFGLTARKYLKVHVPHKIRRKGK